MTFQNILHKNSIHIDTTSQSRSAVLLNLSKLLNKHHPELNANELFNLYWERESLGSTTIGNGILIPHICIKSIKKTYTCFIKLKNPVDFNAEDKQPIDLIFGLVSSSDNTDYHLQVLSKIVSVFHDRKFILECRNTNDITELAEILTKEKVNNYETT